MSFCNINLQPALTLSNTVFHIIYVNKYKSIHIINGDITTIIYLTNYLVGHLGGSKFL